MAVGLCHSDKKAVCRNLQYNENVNMPDSPGWKWVQTVQTEAADRYLIRLKSREEGRARKTYRVEVKEDAVNAKSAPNVEQIVLLLLLLPLLGRKSRGWRVIPNGLAAVAASLITGGAASLYAFSRGLSFAGVSEHVESVAACAITVGWFASICYLLDSVKEKEERDKRPWVIGLIAYGIYVLGIRFRTETFVAIELLFWAIIPAAWAVKEKMKKKQKGG